MCSHIGVASSRKRPSALTIESPTAGTPLQVHASRPQDGRACCVAQLPETLHQLPGEDSAEQEEGRDGEGAQAGAGRRRAGPRGPLHGAPALAHEEVARAALQLVQEQHRQRVPEQYLHAS